jgi:hypothetical protein
MRIESICASQRSQTLNPQPPTLRLLRVSPLLTTHTLHPHTLDQSLLFNPISAVEDEGEDAGATTFKTVKIPNPRPSTLDPTPHRN